MLTWVDFTRADRQEIAWNQLFKALDVSLTAASASAPPAPATVQPGSAASTSTASAPSSFRERKKQTLEKRMANLLEEYEAVNNQLDSALNAADRLRLKRQLETIEQEIGQVENELRAL